VPLAIANVFAHFAISAAETATSLPGIRQRSGGGGRVVSGRDGVVDERLSGFGAPRASRLFETRAPRATLVARWDA
jgi:hypothetical protein